MKNWSTKSVEEFVEFNRRSRSAVFRRFAAALAIVFAVIAATVPGAIQAGSTSLSPTSPVSVSLLPSGEGWILSVHRCAATTCVGVEQTSNDGQTWSSVSLPSQLQKLMGTTLSKYYPFAQLSIYFANAKNGWIYGAAPNTKASGTTDAVLWSTHDGGNTWFPVHATSLGMKFNILSMSTSRGQVYAIGWLTDQTFGLWRSPVATDSWRRVSTPTLYSAAGGTSMEGALVFKGAGGWLMVGNDRGVTGSARLTTSGRWVKWTGPCGRVGGSFAPPVAYSSTDLIDVCTIGGYGGGVTTGTPRKLKIGTNWILSSHDGGRTFVPTIQIGVDNTSQWLESAPGLPASPEPGVLFVAKSIEKGQTAVQHLFSTRNGGKTWTSVYTPSSGLTGAIQLVTFASPILGAAIVQITSSTSILIISKDGGTTWRRTST